MHDLLLFRVAVSVSRQTFREAALPSADANAPHRYRALFISDTHLGTRGCRADYLLDFLRHNECDTPYLVGDVIDGWALRKTFYWPQSHNDVVQ